MVKTQKMSKQSIAIIALSLLLVLSMVIALTGAWFTDSDTGTKGTDITFGQVNIQETVGDIILTGVIDINNVLPGDTFGLDASITSENATVDMWVYVTVSTLFEIDGEPYAMLYDAEGTPVITYSALTMEAGAEGWAAQSPVEVYAGKWYKLTVTGADAASFTGGLHFEEAMANIVYSDEEGAVPVVLNNVNTPWTAVTATLDIQLDVQVIQAAYVSTVHDAATALGIAHA